MSKFIRTENRIYQVESTLRDNGFVKGYNVGEMAFIRKDQVINQSDTIEELCDEFVIVNNICFNMPQLLGTETITIDRDYKHEKVYGAIWTDKGLIYVAKLNDKGDLELI